MTTLEVLGGVIYDVRIQRTRWQAWREAWHDAKDWQVALLDWASGCPIVVGDPASRHWTRWGARRAADWANLRSLPMGAANRFRYTVLPTRHPAVC